MNKRFPTPNFLDACKQYMNETGTKDVRLGAFLSWLQSKNKK